MSWDAREMQVVQVPVTAQQQHPAFSDQFVRTRQIILGLTVSLILNYLVILLPLDLSALGLIAFAVPFPAFYNIVECSCFFGCKQFSYCSVLTFRIIFVLSDFGFFITYCVWGGYGATYVACIVFLLFAMCLNVTIMVLFGRLPRYDGCCCPPPVVTQQSMVYTTSPIQQPYVIQPGVQTGQVIQLPNGQQVICQPQGTVPVKGTEKL